MSDDDYVEMDYDSIKATPSIEAILFMRDGEEQWVPVKNIDMDEFDPNNTGPGTVMIKEWFAFKEGII